jgi:hypothetical protein
VSVAEQVLMLVFVAGLKNPIFDPDSALGFNKAYAEWRGKTLLDRARGVPYQIQGPTHRGDGAPDLTAAE